MKKTGHWGKIGIVAALAMILVISLMTLTACSDKVELSAIEVVGDTVPGVAVVDEFDISQISLTLILADGTVQKISAERSMLTAESREALKTPGQKNITLFYNKQTVVIPLFLVEAGTETVSVSFLDADGVLLGKRYAVMGGSVVAPTPPVVDGKMFSGWISSADGTTLDLSKVNSSVIVNASYSDNLSSYTVTFVDYKGNTIDTVTVQHGKKIQEVPSYTSPAELQSWKWSVDVNIYKVESNVTINMTDIVYKTHTVQYYYTYSNQTDTTYPILDSNRIHFSEGVKVNTPALKKEQAKQLLSNQGGVALVFVNWLYEPATIAGDTVLIAVVEPRTYTVSFADGYHDDASVNVGTTYMLPTTAKDKYGWEFNGQWLEANSGEVLTGSVKISANLNLSPIYNRKAVQVKFVVTFSGILDGNKDTVKEYSINRLFEDIVDIEFITTYILPEVKLLVIGSTDYQVDTILYGEDEVTSDDVTSEDVSLSIKTGDAVHKFFVTAVDPSLPTSGLEFTLQDNKYTVSAYEGSAVNIFIPKTYSDDGVLFYPVTAIGADVFKNRTVNITLPDTITRIGSNAFENATFFGDLDFGSVSELGVDVFRGAKTKNEKDIKVTLGELTAIPSYTFYGSKNITEVVLAGTVVTVGEYAFYNSDIVSINLSNITNIGDFAFCNSKLTNVNSLQNVQSVGESAFEGTLITALNLPKLSTIGKFAFANMDSLAAFSVGTELSLNEGEGNTFDVTCINGSFNIITITIGEGYNKLYMAAEDLEEAGFLTETVNLPASWTETEVCGIGMGDISPEIYILGGMFRYIKNINVASGNTVYASVDGILYDISGIYATLLLYPGDRNGNFVIPATVSGKDVTKIDHYAFIIATINTLTIGENIELDNLPALVFAEKIIMSVVIDSDLLGQDDAVESALLSVVAAFDIGTHIYIDGSVDNFAEIVSDNNLENVFMLSNGAYSIYNSNYDLVYTVSDNKATIIYGNKKASTIVIPQTIDGFTVNSIVDGAFSGYVLLQTLTVNAVLNGLSLTVLSGCTSLANISIAGFTSGAVVNMSAFADTKYYAAHNLIVLGGRLIGYNNAATTKNDRDEIVSLTVVTAADLAGITALPDNFFMGSNLTSITLSDSVKTIGKNTFQNCTSLLSINLNKVTSIKDGAFANSGLESINLLGVTDLGVSVFKGCESLAVVNIPGKVNGGSLPYGSFEDCTALTMVDMPSITQFADNEFANSRAFANCSMLSNISFINRLSRIPGEAFDGCSAIVTIDFTKSSVLSIGAGAFKDCSSLGYLVISADVSTIGGNAFSGCSALETIKIIGTGGILSYYAAEPLATGVFPESANIFVSVNAIGAKDAALSNYSDKVKTVLPKVEFAIMPNFGVGETWSKDTEDDIAYLTEAPSADEGEYEDFVFDGWYRNVSGTYVRVTFPMLVSEDITLYAKYYSLTKGSLINEDLEYHNEDGGWLKLVSYNNQNAAEVYIPQSYHYVGVVTIGGNQVQIDGIFPILVIDVSAFAACGNLKRLVIPEGVTEIVGSTTFNNNLEYIKLPASLEKIEGDVFNGLSNLDIEFAPSSMLLYADRSVFEGSKWYEEELANATDISKRQNNGFILAGRLAITYVFEEIRENEYNGTVTLPNDVIKLNDELFNCSVPMGEVLTEEQRIIKEFFRELRINDNLQYIGSNCFTDATNLEYVNYVSGSSYNSKLKELDLNLFSGTKWLANQNMVIVGTILVKYNDRSGETTVTIPDGITEISAYAFENVTLSYLVFGANSKLKVIGDYAFRNSYLTIVNLPSNVAVLGKGVFQNCTKLTSADLSATKITELSEELFYGCNKLVTLTLSNKVVAFRKASLIGCEKLATIIATGLSDTANLANDPNAPNAEYCGLDTTKWYQVTPTVTEQYLILGKVLIKYIPSTLVTEEEVVAAIPTDLGIETILSHAFASSEIKINKVIIPLSVKYIESKAFAGIAVLKKVEFATGNSLLEVIGEGAFYNCSSLEEIVFPVGLERIEKDAFASTILGTVLIPDSVVHLGQNSFANNQTLSYVKIGSGVQELGRGVFANCNNLYKVEWRTNEQQLTDIAKYIEGIVSDIPAYQAYLNGLFVRDNGQSSHPIRLYMDRDSYNFVVNINLSGINVTDLDRQINAWATTATYTLSYENNYPEVMFEDEAGYYKQSFRAEIITEALMGTDPAKTDHTFAGWYLDSDFEQPLILPHKVYADIQLYAKWYANKLSSVDSDNLSFIYNAKTDTYTVSGVNNNPEVLFIPTMVGMVVDNELVYKIVDSINLTANATTVKKLVLTNASNFNGMQENIFRFFTNLEELVLLNTDTTAADYKIEDGVVYSIDDTRLIAYIARFKTVDGEKVKESDFTILNKVTEIANYAFINSDLSSLTIPYTVTKIGYRAFNNGLTTIVFSKSASGQVINIISADSNSFSNTVWYTSQKEEYKLQGTDTVVGLFYTAANILLEYKERAVTNNLIIPNQINGYNITTLGSNINSASRTEGNQLKMTFANLQLPQMLQRINSFALKDIDITTNILEANALINLVDIADNVFDDTNFYKSSDMLVLGKVLIKWISMETNVKVPDGIVAISSNAFENSQLVTLELPDSLKTIGDYAFSGCLSLVGKAKNDGSGFELVIPSSVVSIGSNAFASNTALGEVKFQTNQSKINSINSIDGNNAFVPLTIGEKAFVNCSSLTNIKIPPYVTELSNDVFMNCKKLKTVTFDNVLVTEGPNNTTVEKVTKSKLNLLGSGAFYNCEALSEISIPNNISIIEQNTFYNCISLLNVNFDNTKSKLKTIAERAFYNCNKLGSKLNLNAPDLITVVMPNSLETIKANAFEKCSGMFGMKLNYHIKTIERDVFLGCVSLAKLSIYSATPANLSLNAFKRSTDTATAYYKLRIYVNISSNNSIKRQYQHSWSEYSLSIFEHNELPKVTYSRLVSGAGGTTETQKSQEFSADVLVNPSHTWGTTNYNTWLYISLDTIRLNEISFEKQLDPGTGAVILDSSIEDPRLNKELGYFGYQLYEQGGNQYKLLILDYDHTLLRNNA